MPLKFPNYQKILAGLIIAERIHNTLISFSSAYATFVENSERKIKKKLGILRTLHDEIVDYFGSDELISYQFETDHKIQDPVLKSYLHSILTVKKVLSPKENGNNLCLEDFYSDFDYLDIQDFMEQEASAVTQKFPFGPYFLAEKETRTGIWPSSFTFAEYEGTPLILHAPETDYDTATQIDLLFREEDLDTIEELQDKLTEQLRTESIVKNWVIYCDNSQESEFDFHEDACRELRTGNHKFDINLYNDEIQNLIQRDIPGFIEKQETFCEHGYDGRRAFMLEGPPGTGKSHIIRSVISILPKHYTTIILDHKNIEQLQEISRYKFLFPALVVIEDIDLLLGSRPRKQILLNFLDGINAPEQMITIMTSNSLDTLTEAIIDRPGRVDRVIHVGPGNERQRIAQVESLTRGIRLPPQISADAIAARSEGFTVAQLRELIRRTAIYTQNFSGELSAEAVETVLQEFEQTDKERQARRRQNPEKQGFDFMELIESSTSEMVNDIQDYHSWDSIKKRIKSQLKKI